MRPGSKERIEYYRIRASLGLPLFEHVRRPDLGWWSVEQNRVHIPELETTSKVVGQRKQRIKKRGKGGK